MIRERRNHQQTVLAEIFFKKVSSINNRFSPCFVPLKLTPALKCFLNLKNTTKTILRYLCSMQLVAKGYINESDLNKPKRK